MGENKSEDEAIKRTMEILEEMSMDPKEWELYESRRLAIMDYNTGIHQARIEGEEESKIKIAKKLLKLGMKIEEIKEVTGLSIEEIEKLK